MGAADWETEFAEYFTAQHGVLRRLAYTLCGDWHHADDVVQHTFVQLYRHWRRVQPASLDAYVRTILRHWRSQPAAPPRAVLPLTVDQLIEIATDPRLDVFAQP